MADYLTEVAYAGRDNAIELELTEDGTSVSLSSLTRVVLDLGAHEIDSDQEVAEVFDWSSGTRLVMKLGLVQNATQLVGTYPARLIVYSVTEPNGVVWLDPIIIRILGPKE